MNRIGMNEQLGQLTCRRRGSWPGLTAAGGGRYRGSGPVPRVSANAVSFGGNTDCGVAPCLPATSGT
jgi:hypothetical protein